MKPFFTMTFASTESEETYVLNRNSFDLGKSKRLWLVFRGCLGYGDVLADDSTFFLNEDCAEILPGTMLPHNPSEIA
jgi:hypothetical protein